MAVGRERILIIESDPEISDLIGRQSLRPLGYQVRVVNSAPTALQEAVRLAPDVVIVNLNMPGLSGKDILVALNSQGISVPVIVIAEQGMERDVIQAFRLGAYDYLSWPIREAEAVAAVERALGQVRARREREDLARKLELINRELQARVRELTTIFGIGKAVTSLTDQKTLFNKIIDGAIDVTEADKGWLLLRRGESKVFTLNACKNMPKSVTAKLNQPWDDGISSLVALSGESLSIHGDPLRRFKIAQLGKAALVVPVKAQKEVVGLLVMLREVDKPFNPSNQAMLEAVADYASISLVNARLFQALEERAGSLQKAIENSKDSERLKAEILKNVSQELQTPLTTIEHQLRAWMAAEDLRKDQQDSLRVMHQNLKKLFKLADAIASLQKASSPQELVHINLMDLTRQMVERYRSLAKAHSVTLTADLPPKSAHVVVDVTQIARVFDVLLSNAIRQSANGGQVFLTIGQDRALCYHISVQDSGPGMEEIERQRIFEPFYKGPSAAANPDEAIGIGLALAKEIVKAHGGEMWVESKLASGSTFHFTLRPAII